MELEIPRPIGDFIMKNAEGLQLLDGRYYHYSDVCSLLKKYAKQQATNDSKAIDLFDEIYDIIHYIQGSGMGSIGSINTHYLPQLRVEEIDSIEVKIRQYIKGLCDL